MAPNRVSHTSWIIFVFALVLSLHSSDGATKFEYVNGTTNTLPFNENNAHLIQAPINLVYQGNNYKQFYVSNNGFVMFTNEKSDVTYVAQNWSADDVSPFIDVPFIAPYYFEAQPLNVLKGYIGRVMYQQLTNASGNGQDLQNLGKYISSLTIGGKQFNPKWAILISWVNVTSKAIVEQGACSPLYQAPNPCPVDSFQLMLLTDGDSSYAVFNYIQMDLPTGRHDQAGFNGGQGIGFYSVLGSSVGVDQLIRLQSSDLPGRYVFDITSGTIVRGGCNTDTSEPRLSVSPNFGGMFGGKVIELSGPCFPSAPRCMFTDPYSQLSFNGTIVSVTQTRVQCVVPRMTIRGQITVRVSLDNGRTYPYKSPFTIVFPGRMPSSEHVTTVSSSTNMAWFSINPTTLTLSWTPTLLANRSHLVDVTLYGYREDAGQPMFTKLTGLGTGVNGWSGSYSVDPVKYQCAGQTCLDYEVGVVEVRLQDGVTPNQYKFLSSKVIPLGWYVNSAMTAQYGVDWSTQKCVNWYNQDRQNMDWTDNLLSCPCSLSQALADYGRFQPDHGCSLMNKDNPENCFYHKGAVHCVRAVQPTPGGAGNQCCYNKAGTLVFAADSFQGSTPDRSHDWGAAPYGKPGYVPTLSHWIRDVVTFYYCCLWVENKSCDYYMDQRPTKDCVGYEPPVLASVFGQGHVIGFGGNSFRVLGHGDFILLKSGNTTLQGRFVNTSVPASVADGPDMNYSYILSGVSVQDAGTSDKVEIQLHNRDFDRSVKYIDIRVNGQLVNFNEDSMRWQDFRGVAVVNTDYVRKLQSNFTVILTNGIGFQVAVMADTLQLDVMVPSTNSAVSGLFGTLSGDLIRPNGTSINSTITPRDLYYTYELQWAVPSESDSLFLSFHPANYTLGKTITFNLERIPNLNQNMITNLCKSYDSCLFDYRTTGSQDLARSSFEAQSRYNALSDSLQPVRTCGLLNVPRAIKDNIDIGLGSQTTVTGCRFGALSGHTTYTCTPTSNETQAWSPAVTATCQVPTEKATTALLVGILVPCVVVVFIAIIVAVCIYKKRKRKRNARPPKVPEFEARYNTSAEVEKERYPPARRPSNESSI